MIFSLLLGDAITFAKDPYNFFVFVCRFASHYPLFMKRLASVALRGTNHSPVTEAGGNHTVRRHAASANLSSSATPKNVTDNAENFVIFRREMAEGNVKSFPLSIDVTQKRFIDMFNDYENKRCRLCNEAYLQWGGHSNANIPHIAREAVLLEMVRANCGTPEELVQMWWKRLHTSPKFKRIPSLSHDISFKRKRRLQYLLTVLRDKKILRECFNVVSTAPTAASGGSSAFGSPSSAAVTNAARSFEFERLEWVGDNVMKYILNNRISVLFPYTEGGTRGKITFMQFMMDGNDGLARGYDHLELQKLTMSKHVVSKFKSDVVETMFGELQLYLWSTQRDVGTEVFPTPLTPDLIPIRQLVQHVMEEIGHCIVMYHIEFILGNLMKVVKDNQVQFVRTEMLTASQVASASSTRAFGAIVQRVSSGNKGVTASTTSGSGKQLSASKSTIASNVSRDLFLMRSNYDVFRCVASLGGLLPRPFPPAALTATAAFLPMMQRARISSTALGKGTESSGFEGILEECSRAHTSKMSCDELSFPRLTNDSVQIPGGELVNVSLDMKSRKQLGLVPTL